MMTWTIHRPSGGMRRGGPHGRRGLVGEGTYHLDRPVTVRHDNVVIRGTGRLGPV